MGIGGYIAMSPWLWVGVLLDMTRWAHSAAGRHEHADDKGDDDRQNHAVSSWIARWTKRLCDVASISIMIPKI